MSCHCNGVGGEERLWKLVLQALRHINNGLGGTVNEILIFIKKSHNFLMRDSCLMHAVVGALKKASRIGFLKKNPSNGKYYVACTARHKSKHGHTLACVGRLYAEPKRRCNGAPYTNNEQQNYNREQQERNVQRTCYDRAQSPTTVGGEQQKTPGGERQKTSGEEQQKTSGEGQQKTAGGAHQENVAVSKSQGQKKCICGARRESVAVANSCQGQKTKCLCEAQNESGQGRKLKCIRSPRKPYRTQTTKPRRLRSPARGSNKARGKKKGPRKCRNGGGRARSNAKRGTKYLRMLPKCLRSPRENKSSTRCLRSREHKSSTKRPKYSKRTLDREKIC